MAPIRFLDLHLIRPDPCRWSALTRHERFRKRNGGDYVDSSNPLPGWIDRITMDEIVAPAISPYGHILGSATWKASSADFCRCLQRKASDWVDTLGEFRS